MMLASRIKDCQVLIDKNKHKFQAKHIHDRLLDAQLNLTIRDSFIDKFWSHFGNSKESKHHDSFLDAIDFLSESCEQIDKYLDQPTHISLKEKFYFVLKTQILASKPHYLDEHLSATYIRAFEAFIKLEKADLDDESENIKSDEDNELDDDGLCPGCGSSSIQECNCANLYERFCIANDCLSRLNLLEFLVGDIVMDTARLFIERRVNVMTKSNYSHSYLDELTLWVHQVPRKWVLKVYGSTESEEYETIGRKLDASLRDAYSNARLSYMFEIIIDYPDSDAAIQDLKMSLDQSTSPDFRLNLIGSVKQALIDSLLHPGVNTYDIITAYISTIKALRALDPSGLILQLVTEPVRRYLKSRDDTVKFIVTALTDEDHNSELNRELLKSGCQTNESNFDDNEGQKCTQDNFEIWKPDPIKLNPSDDVMKSSRFSDIVSILVNIYETKDLFVEEYQNLLSQRLLNKYDECNLEIELRNLELLTMRFKDCELHRCEVMLKDVQTSKKINRRILSGDIRDHKLENFKDINVLVISSPFWPNKFGAMASLSEEPPEIVFPPEIESAMTEYTNAFQSIQASRTLHWRHHLGQVNLDLTINGRTQNFVVTPLHASLLYLFKEKKSWKLADLMHKTSIPAATLRSRLALWQRNGVIRDCGSDKYDLILDQ